MKTSTIIFLTLTLIACGPRRPGKYGAAGTDGKNGSDGISAGVDIADAGTDVCANGGVVLSSFKDYNNDGVLDINEPVNSVKTVCNGIDGTNASVNLGIVPVSVQCPAGGISISSSTSATQVVCNGKDGLNGSQGIQGVQGAPGVAGPAGPQGPAGVNGSTIVPVKFCSSSTAAFPEYGLKLGDDVFAVYWSGSNAFLAKLTPGNYVTTTGTQDCNFTIVAGAPVGATHKLTFCGQDVYKTGTGLVYGSTTYTSANGNSFSVGSCNVVYNNNGQHVNVHGSVSCNYNNVSNLNTGANVGTGCTIVKL